jgi:deoxyribose-phosphate aldolase
LRSAGLEKCFVYIRRMFPEYAAVAKLIDHALLAPTLTEDDLEEGLSFARRYDVASVCIVPFAVARAREVLSGSDVRVGTVIGFPHGSHATRIKVAEAELALADGAEELDAVVNVNRVLSEDFADVAREIAVLTELTHARGGKIKIIFENCYLQDRHKIRLCEIAGECGADWVKTSTGVGPSGATMHDLALMRRHAPAAVQVKASGGVRDLDTVLGMREFVTRCGTSRSREILDECRTRVGMPVPIGR